MPTIEDAKRRATVRLPDGRLAILLGVRLASRTLKVVTGGRHLTIPARGVVVVQAPVSREVSDVEPVGIGPEDGPVPTSVDVS